MQRSFSLLVVTLTGVAVLLYAALLRHGLAEGLTESFGPGLAYFLIVALIAEFMAVDFRFGNDEQQPRASLAYLPFLAGIVLFPPHVSVGVVIAVVTFSQAALRRKRPLRLLYNVSQATLSAAVGALFYHHVMGGIPGLFAAAVLFFFVNIVLTSIAISQLRSTSFQEVFGQFVGPNLGKLGLDLLATPIVLVVVVAYRYDPVSLIVFLPPLFLLHRAFLSLEQLSDAHIDLVRVLVKAIETRDPYTSGHSERVATMAKEIAVAMRLSASKIRMVERAALLHDLGKIDAEYSTVLRKPMELSTEERAMIQTHTLRGAAILQQLRSMPQEIVAAVLHHHEWYNGAGYPDGIKGATIPLAARVIMLCDSIDAMLSDRPYRKALPVEAVRAEVLRCAGTQFDPSIVKVVLNSDILERAQLRTAPEHTKDLVGSACGFD
jgi:putative nucleotidyltransferase with HDIG domain